MTEEKLSFLHIIGKGDLDLFKCMHRCMEFPGLLDEVERLRDEIKNLEIILEEEKSNNKK